MPLTQIGASSIDPSSLTSYQPLAKELAQDASITQSIDDYYKSGANALYGDTVEVSLDAAKKGGLNRIASDFGSIAQIGFNPDGAGYKVGEGVTGRGSQPITSQQQQLVANLERLRNDIAQYQALPGLTDDDKANLQATLSDGVAGVHAVYDSLAQLLDAHNLSDQAANARKAGADLDTYFSGVLQQAGVTDNIQTLLLSAEAKYGTDEAGLVSDGTKLKFGTSGFHVDNITGSPAATPSSTDTPSSSLAGSPADLTALINQVKGSSSSSAAAANAILNQQKTQQQIDAEKALAVAFAVLDRLDKQNTDFQKQQQQKLTDPNGPENKAGGYTSSGGSVASAGASNSAVRTA